MVKEALMKQTEIGLIPEDWEVQELQKILKFGSGKDYKHLLKGEIPVYGTGGLMTFVNDFLYDGESVGIGRKGTIDKPVFLQGKFWTVDTLFFTHSFINTLPKFIYYQFNRIRWKEYNEASGVPSLNKKTLEQIEIPLPPLAEQEAIATALSDCDAWIESLEQVVAKKRLIKQGAMQQLLTPREDWEVKKLGEVCEFKNGAAHENVVDENGDYVIVNSKFISQEGRIRKHSNAFLCPLFKNEIVMVMSDIPNGKALAKCFIIDQNNTYTLNQRICAFEVKEDFNSKFLFYKINRNVYFLSFDSGSGQTNLRRNEVLNCPISFPPLSEQTRIATILADMDLEIEALTQKLNKGRQIKQGMMQQLLTGSVRLV